MINMTTAAAYFNQGTRLRELQQMAADSSKTSRPSGVSPGTLQVRPLRDMKRIASGSTFGVDDKGSTALLSNGVVLHELKTREIILELDGKELAAKKKETEDKKNNTFAALVKVKPDPTAWGIGNLKVALTFKRIAKLSELDGKPKDELQELWRKKGNMTVEMTTTMTTTTTTPGMMVGGRRPRRKRSNKRGRNWQLGSLG